MQQKESDLEKLNYELERIKLNQEKRMGDHEAIDQGYPDIHLYIFSQAQGNTFKCQIPF